MKKKILILNGKKSAKNKNKAEKTLEKKLNNYQTKKKNL